MYELIYSVDGKEKKTYPQTKQAVKKWLALIKEGDPVYKLVSCEPCRNYEAYKIGALRFPAFVLSECGKVSIMDVTDEDMQEAAETIIYAPYEYDIALVYYVLCEFSSFKEANDYYREVTA